MTLNGHFALKSGPSSASNELAFLLSERTVLKFAELRIYCQRQKCSPTRDCTGDIRVMELFILSFGENCSEICRATHIL